MRFFRALLRLYPRSFRDEYGKEMEAVWAARRRAAEGPLARLALSLDAVADTLASASAVHLDVLKQDLRWTARGLARSPGFALTAIAVSALGIGANTAAFTVADFVLVRPLPYRGAERLVKIWEKPPGGGRNEVAPPNWRDWKALSSSFEGMAAYAPGSVNLVGSGEPARLESANVTPDLFPLLGVRPLLGRPFTAADAKFGAPGTVILAYGLWQTQFGGERDVLGKTVTLDGAPHVVIGVMPRGFSFPSRAVQLFAPLVFGPQGFDDRNDNYLKVLAKLKPDVPLARAQAEMDVIASGLERRWPKENEGVGVTIVTLREELSSQARLLLLALSGAALSLLLITCANLASLLLARALTRRRELSVRAALGAGRERLVRQLVTESLVLAALGGACGVLVALGAVPLLSHLVPDALPVAQAPAIDPRILLFAAAVTAATGLGFGVIPALAASRRLDVEALREGVRSGGGRRQRVRSLLVVAEVAATVVLLVSAGLLMRALWRIQAVDPGFRAEGVLTLRTALPWPKYEKTAVRERFYARVLGDARRLPGVASAAYMSFLPMAFPGGIGNVLVEGETRKRGERSNASFRFTTPGYFATMRIPLLKGRDVSDADRLDTAKVAVVSAALARRHWPDGDPLGRRISILGETWTIVGVVGDVRVRGPERASEPQVYFPYNQQPDGNFIAYPPKDLVVRASGDLGALVPAIRRIVHEADPDQPISNVRTLEAIVADQTASRAAQVRILGAFAGVALLLAGVGIHGVLAYLVASRGQEIGVRLALGAQPRDVVRMVTEGGVRLALAGLVPGALLAWSAGRAMQALLAGVQPADPAAFGAALGLCLAMTVLGSLVPAMRAVRIAPASVMRSE